MDNNTTILRYMMSVDISTKEKSKGAFCLFNLKTNEVLQTRMIWSKKKWINMLLWRFYVYKFCIKYYKNITIIKEKDGFDEDRNT